MEKREEEEKKIQTQREGKSHKVNYKVNYKIVKKTKTGERKIEIPAV